MCWQVNLDFCLTLGVHFKIRIWFSTLPSLSLARKTIWLIIKLQDEWYRGVWELVHAPSEEAMTEGWEKLMLQGCPSPLSGGRVFHRNPGWIIARLEKRGGERNPLLFTLKGKRDLYGARFSQETCFAALHSREHPFMNFLRQVRHGHWKREARNGTMKDKNGGAYHVWVFTPAAG